VRTRFQGRPGIPRRSEHYPRHKCHEIIVGFRGCVRTANFREQQVPSLRFGRDDNSVGGRNCEPNRRLRDVRFLWLTRSQADSLTKLSSRPERSEVEGPAVPFSSASSHAPSIAPSNHQDGEKRTLTPIRQVQAEVSSLPGFPISAVRVRIIPRAQNSPRRWDRLYLCTWHGADRDRPAW
jgi:hypothetical protein